MPLKKLTFAFFIAAALTGAGLSFLPVTEADEPCTEQEAENYKAAGCCQMNLSAFNLAQTNMSGMNQACLNSSCYNRACMNLSGYNLADPELAGTDSSGNTGDSIDFAGDGPVPVIPDGTGIA